MAGDTSRRPVAAPSRRNLVSGLLFGVGLVAFVDEAVFHQILRWHHFYDRGTSDMGLVSDGFFHALSWAATIGALFLFADLRRRGIFDPLAWWGGTLIGAGAFQLYDGLVQHKLFGLHEIRYVPDLIVYDVVWNVIAVSLLLVGLALFLRSRRGARAAE